MHSVISWAARDSLALQWPGPGHARTREGRPAGARPMWTRDLPVPAGVPTGTGRRPGNSSLSQHHCQPASEPELVTGEPERE